MEEASMAFRGWPVEALEFFEGLEADNSKAYWQSNKTVYETLVRAPMEELIAELAPEWGEGRIFRPYRDVRFSAEKPLLPPCCQRPNSTLSLPRSKVVRR